MKVLLIAAVPDPHLDPAWFEPDMIRSIDVREGCVGVVRLVNERDIELLIESHPVVERLTQGHLRNQANLRVISEEEIQVLAPDQTIVFFVGGTGQEMQIFKKIKHWPHVFPISSTGLAAAEMLDEIEERLPRNLVSILRRETAYGHVAHLVYVHVTES